MLCRVEPEISIGVALIRSQHAINHALLTKVLHSPYDNKSAPTGSSPHFAPFNIIRGP